MPACSSSPASSALLCALWGLLQRHRVAFRQERVFRPMQALILWHLFSFASRTITQALVALGLTKHDWTAYYRLFNELRIDYEELTRCFLTVPLAHIPQEHPYVSVVDSVQVPRHSHKMPGTSWLKSLPHPAIYTRLAPRPALPAPGGAAALMRSRLQPGASLEMDSGLPQKGDAFSRVGQRRGRFIARIKVLRLRSQESRKASLLPGRILTACEQPKSSKALSQELRAFCCRGSNTRRASAG